MQYDDAALNELAIKSFECIMTFMGDATDSQVKCKGFWTNRRVDGRTDGCMNARKDILAAMIIGF